jgi:hypothetical protein
MVSVSYERFDNGSRICLEYEELKGFAREETLSTNREDDFPRGWRDFH